MSDPATTTAAAKLAEEFQAWSQMLRSGALDAAQFAKEQIPGILQEVLRFALADALISCAVALAFLFAAARLGFSSWRAGRTDYDEQRKKYEWFRCEWKPRYLLGVSSGLVVSACALVCFFYNARIALMVLVAPRAYLMDYLGGLLK